MAKRRGRPSAVKPPPPPPGPFRGAWTRNGQLLPKAKWLLWLLGGGFILMSAVGVADELPALMFGARAEAEVVTIRDEGPDSYYAHLQIEGVGPATTVRLERYRRQPSLRVGQRLTVAYRHGGDESKPAAVVPLNAAARWPGSLFYSCFAVFLLWLSRQTR